MTLTLHLGVVELPYTNSTEFDRYHHAMKKALGEGYSRHMTTGDVADLLEARYHPMEHFVQLHGQEVADNMASSMAGALESLMMGAPATIDPLGTATGKIKEGFARMLESGELERMGYPGLPTDAALKRQSLRFKDKKNPRRRPSLIDTGLYQSSFKAWTEGAP